MNLTYVDDNSLKSLEDYAVFMTAAMLTFKTLQNFQVRAIEIGIMPQEMNERANTIIWDLRRLINLSKDQLEAILALVPDDFDATAVIETMKRQQLTKARQMTRRSKVKE